MQGSDKLNRRSDSSSTACVLGPSRQRPVVVRVVVGPTLEESVPWWEELPVKAILPPEAGAAGSGDVTGVGQRVERGRAAPEGIMRGGASVMARILAGLSAIASLFLVAGAGTRW